MLWLPLALTAMFMLVARRSTEKRLTGPLSAGSMAWLQQLVAMPFMIALLPAAHFYLPGELSATFYIVTIFYVLAQSVDIIMYFKAIEVGDISVVAPLLALTAASSLVGSYFVLGQVPTPAGVAGSLLIMAGAYLTSRRPNGHPSTATNNRLAIILALIIVALRGVYSASEVIPLRLTNPVYFNFVTSLIGIPTIMAAIYLRGRHTGRPLISAQLIKSAARHRAGLVIIGLTYTLNLTATFSAKLLSPNAAYVTAVRGAQVLPIVLIGATFFHERVIRRQWVGVGLILVGMACFFAA
ncbi:MAG TPA: hypothetical protein VHQ86_04215 [Candidatus Saccharimonadia bacterium]|jgi:drug/metabolite transporter (DMT)-like permease|nr:hypothetical protein [Candidatus Saccharimonadia bacterium]